MHRRRKISAWIAGGIGALLIILLAIIFFLPRLVDLHSVQEKIKDGIALQIAGTVDFRKMEVALFPRPRIVIRQARFSLPEKAEGTFDSISIYPKIFPILYGEVRIGGIQIEAPTIALLIPKKKDGDTKPPLSVQEMGGDVSGLLNVLASHMPGTRIKIEKGVVGIYDGDIPLFTFQDLEGQVLLPPGEAGIDLSGSSNFSKNISLGLRFDAANLTGTCTFKTVGMDPRPAVRHFFPDWAGRLGESEANLLLSFKMRGLKDMEAEVKGSLPYLTLLNGNEKVPLQGINIHAALTLAADRTEIALREMKLEHPRLSLSGALSMDKGAQDTRMEISGSQVDVASLRGVALSLAGDLPIVQNVFAHVRGGRVPFITVHSRGASIEDLGKRDSLLIKGLMQQGEIHVPGPQLDFREVSGECIISRGILEGKNVQGKLGNSLIRDGKLTIGLTGEDAPLHIDLGLKADLADARAVMKRVINDEPFLKEMELISALHGEAEGRLILGESIASITPRLDLSEVSFTVQHRRVPFPLAVKGGQFSYERKRIGIKKLSGTLGRTSFREITGEMQLGDSPAIDIQSGSLRIVQDEVYPWLTSFSPIGASLQELRSLKGALHLGTVQLKGPLFKPEKWRFRLTGSIEDMVADWALLPGPASLKKGTFEATERKISFAAVRTDILDASLVLSGTRQGYSGGSPKTDLAFQGRMGARACRWASGLASLPFPLRDAVTFERARVVLDKETSLFQGALRAQKGLRITADVLKHSKGLTINRLVLRDGSTDASLSFDLREKDISFAFAGKLNSETLNAMIKAEELPQGRVSGNFRADIEREKPFRFNAGGRLRAEGIVFPAKWAIPVEIENLSLAGSGETLAIESSALRLDDTPFSLKGSLHCTREDLGIDMDLSANRIVWGKISKIQETAGETDKGSKDTRWRIPFKGIVRVKANEFVFDKYTWMPLQADITFHNDEMNITVNRAALCGVSTPGTIHVSPKGLSLDFQPHAENQELQPVLACLIGRARDVTGTFDLKARITGSGQKEHVRDSLSGDVECVARDGRIYGRPALLNMFTFLEVNQILRGFPEIRQEGLAYQSIKATGELRQGTLRLKEAVVEGPSMKIVSQGVVDFRNDKMDLHVLICPLKTTDFIISKTPILGSILGGSLISIPLTVSGSIDDPKVSYNPVTAVGSGLLGMMERTLKAPLKLFELPLSDGKKRDIH